VVVDIEQLLSLKDKTVLITGASGNLGKSFVNTLIALEADVILIDKQSEEFERFVMLATAKSSNIVSSFSCDFESPESRKKLIDVLVAKYPRIDILINNAAFVGVSNLQGWVTAFEDQTNDTWNRALEVNLTSVFDLVKGLLPSLKMAKNASVINIASIYGSRSPDWQLYEGTNLGNPAAYAASKGGLIQLTRWLATTLPTTIRVNAISPGGIQREQPKEFIQKYSAHTALGRMATEDDIQGALIFLATNMSEYITGQVIQVDGGWKL
jgi:NAD(P)-dependent dehydrogenase (short-subunit alcohol dehydrogenase family)